MRCPTFLLLLGLLLPFAQDASAAVRKPVNVQQPVTKLTKGSSNVTRDPRTGAPLPQLTFESCPAIRDAIIEFDGQTRTTGNNVYKCVTEQAAIVAFVANQTCAPPRLPETKQESCPAGSTGTFTQTRAWTIAPYPTCEMPGAWLPQVPSAIECPLAPLPAPTGVTATAFSTTEIRLRWNPVPDAVSYSVRRCSSADCDPASQPQLICTQQLQQPHVTLPSGVTIRYQIGASRTANCGEVGALSLPIVSATTPTGPVIEPGVCTALTCPLSWSYGGPTADGFRIVYGQSPTQLPQSIQVAGAVFERAVTVPAPGVWYFAVIASRQGQDSPLSNIEMRTVRQ